MRYFIYTFLLSLGLCSVVLAEVSATKTIRVIGRQDVVTTKKMLQLSDVAAVHSKHVKDNEAIIALKKIEIAKSPKPGKEMTLNAAKILESLKKQGVNLNSIGYSFARMTKIKRASRAITKQELEIAIQEQIDSDKLDIVLQNIVYPNKVEIVPGIAEFDVSLRKASRKGQYNAFIVAKVKNEQSVKFTVKTKVEEWAEIPVANRPLYRGAIIRQDDIVMARLKTTDIPANTAYDTSHIVGKETNREIRSGEVFRKNKLHIPPSVLNGEKVLLQFKTKLLEATATGVALQDGIIGQKIQIRNDRSKKIVVGEVLEAGLIGVTR